MPFIQPFIAMLRLRVATASCGHLKISTLFANLKIRPFLSRRLSVELASPGTQLALGMPDWAFGSLGFEVRRPELLAIFWGIRSSLSLAYIIHANWSCFRLLRHLMPWAVALDFESAGSSIAARIAMMAMTTNNSIRVNALPSVQPRWLIAAAVGGDMLQLVLILIFDACIGT